MRSQLIALLLASCGIVGSSPQEQADLARYQQNAALYYEGGKLDQAMAQIERGLEIDSDDYKLNRVRAFVLLRKGQDDESRLDEALAAFQKVMDMRSERSHEPDVLLGYAMTLQAMGMRNLTEAQRLQETARRVGTDSSEANVFRSRASEHEARAKSFLHTSRQYLDVLLEKGELVMVSHYHLMQVATALGDYQKTFEHGDAYLEESKRALDIYNAELEKTPSIAYERELRDKIRRQLEQEIMVRTYLADIHYQQGDYRMAVEHLDVVLELDPTRSADYYNRGRCLRELGRTEAAKADFRKFLATSPLPAGNPKKTDAVKALESR